jgi:hypothetical protein
MPPDPLRLLAVPLPSSKPLPPCVLGCTIFSGAFVAENAAPMNGLKSRSTRIHRAPAVQVVRVQSPVVPKFWSAQLI